MYCTTLKRYVFFERRIFHISGKEKRPSSYLQVEVKISRKRVVLRSKYVTRWKSREIGWGSRILSRARILKGPSEFLKTRVIDPLTSGAKKKKEKVFLDSKLVKIGYFRESGGKKNRQTRRFVRESIDRLSNLTKGAVQRTGSTRCCSRVTRLLALFPQEIDTTSAMHLRYSVFRNPHATKNNILLQLPRLFYSSLYRRIKLDSQSRFLNSGFILNLLLNFNRRCE